MKVKIQKWNAVATWRWDIPEDDVCGICQVHFDGTCPACKYPGDDCSLLSGKCGHNFHMVRGSPATSCFCFRTFVCSAHVSLLTWLDQHCIREWIKQESAKGQCPMCRQRFEWDEQHNETSLDTTRGPAETQNEGEELDVAG
ncbi:Anaphase-promoting complex subunit 11 RING-H2 finger domain containing protein [Rhypophila sp. PSN 637]